MLSETDCRSCDGAHNVKRWKNRKRCIITVPAQLGLSWLWLFQMPGQAKALNKGLVWATAFICKIFNSSPACWYTKSLDYSEQYIALSSSSLISSPSHKKSSMSDFSPDSSNSSPTPTSSSWMLVSSASNTEDGRGFQKSNSCQMVHLMHCRASTMSPLRQLWCFDIVILPCKKAHSLDTNDNIIAM